jgi:hypothetical protein
MDIVKAKGSNMRMPTRGDWLVTIFQSEDEFKVYERAGVDTHKT